MAEYELVHEIKNLCRNNQMRDIFFEEVECDDPEAYLRNRLQGKQVELTPEYGPDGAVTPDYEIRSLPELEELLEHRK